MSPVRTTSVPRTTSAISSVLTTSVMSPVRTTSVPRTTSAMSSDEIKSPSVRRTISASATTLSTISRRVDTSRLSSSDSSFDEMSSTSSANPGGLSVTLIQATSPSSVPPGLFSAVVAKTIAVSVKVRVSAVNDIDAVRVSRSSTRKPMLPIASPLSTVAELLEVTLLSRLSTRVSRSPTAAPATSIASPFAATPLSRASTLASRALSVELLELIASLLDVTLPSRAARRLSRDPCTLSSSLRRAETVVSNSSMSSVAELSPTTSSTGWPNHSPSAEITWSPSPTTTPLGLRASTAICV